MMHEPQFSKELWISITNLTIKKLPNLEELDFKDKESNQA